MGNSSSSSAPPYSPSSSSLNLGDLESVENGNRWMNPDDFLQAPVGFRILGVQSQSPAAGCGLVAFFDFIVAANGVPLRTLDSTFLELIKALSIFPLVITFSPLTLTLSQASEEKSLPLAVYNTKNHSLREVVLTPSRRWPGEGLLGLSIRFDTFQDADDAILHILEVEKDSPAQLAGLIPHDDYLLGSVERRYLNPSAFHQDLVHHLNHPLEVFLYSVSRDEVRKVVILPTEDWGDGESGEFGGGGLLGASVGFGYLHRLPASACETLGTSKVVDEVVADDATSTSSLRQSVGVGVSANSAFGWNPPPPPSFTGQTTNSTLYPPLPHTLGSNSNVSALPPPLHPAGVDIEGEQT
eukprot:gene4250-4670_t